ncbi:MAG: histidinol-phosphate transaminase [Candidatus Omnitrophica bacterium 4484_171]|nr:MAG: histidinol-phosphate transaminase [Candidatus Omnitrophica bacterium 4484_171]
MVIRNNLERLKAYKPGKPIEELKRELGLDKIYKLASNESPFYPSHIKKAIISELSSVNRYPQGDCFYLRKLLASKLKVKREQLVFGNGSDDIIIMAIRAFTGTSSNIVVASPTFLIYELQARASGVNVKRVPFNNYRYNLKAMAKSIDKKTAIVFIANPDNPHGTYIHHNELVHFLSLIPGDILVFLDEAYYEFAPRRDFPQSIKLLKERGNIIITRTFSKAYALAGLRIGYAITTSLISETLNKVREPFNVNRFAQAAAIAAVKDNKFIRKCVSYINKEKKFLYRIFTRLDVEYVESATNFILVNFKSDTRELCRYLLKRGVIIRDLSSWGLNGFFRVTVGLHKENAAFVDNFKSYLKIQRHG